jgi:5-methylcytosine-specific restriction endonuclease McrA
MALPRSCATCHGVHAAGQPCPAASQNREQRRGTSTERYGAGWGTTSKRILRRDGWVCQLGLPGCEVQATTVDHTIARINGGPHTQDNLVAACRHCNSAKGAR